MLNERYAAIWRQRTLVRVVSFVSSFVSIVYACVCTVRVCMCLSLCNLPMVFRHLLRRVRARRAPRPQPAPSCATGPGQPSAFSLSRRPASAPARDAPLYLGEGPGEGAGPSCPHTHTPLVSVLPYTLIRGHVCTLAPHTYHVSHVRTSPMCAGPTSGVNSRAVHRAHHLSTLVGQRGGGRERNLDASARAPPAAPMPPPLDTSGTRSRRTASMCGGARGI